MLYNCLAPRCRACADGATKYHGKPSNGDPARGYACDRHVPDEKGWSDLPGASAIRELRMVLYGHQPLYAEAVKPKK